MLVISTTAAQIHLDTAAELIQVAAQLDPNARFKILKDVLQASDAVTTQVVKGLSDAVVAADAIVAFNLLKPLTDTITASDAITVLLAVVRNLTDTITASDGAPRLTTGKGFSDSVAATDETALSAVKALSDAIAASDTIVSAAVIKALTDAVVASEALARSITKPLADAVTAADAGAVRQQDYTIDSTYFAEDYVGIGRSF